MIDYLPDILQFDALERANSIFLFGMILFLGASGGYIFRKIHFPQVVGYIVIGILVGQSGSRLLSASVLGSLEPISSLALSLIGFLIGGELKISLLKKYGKQFTGILLLEAVVPFIVVTVLISVASALVTRDIATSVALGLVLGAIASATAPAATTDVLAENRTKGPLTTMLYGIVAMDDAIALVLFAVASTIAGGLIGERTAGLGAQLVHIVYHVGLSILVGVVFGALLALIMRSLKHDEGRALAFALGLILILTGICTYFSLDSILSAMAMGFFISNYAAARSSDLFRLVDRFTPPVYVLFFVIVGAKLNIWSVSPFLALLALMYVLARTVGKAVGATLGAKITKAPLSVRKYLKWCLLSQAGVAIGLSISAGRIFPESLGPTVILVITATTFVVQLVGPVCVKHGVTKAGECGLDITEEDLLREATVTDVIRDQRIARYLKEDAPFRAVVDAFSRQATLSCPVCDASRHLVGIITIENLKEALLLGDIADGLLACDVMDSSPLRCAATTPVSEIREQFRTNGVDTIPVVSSDGVVEGIIEERSIEKYFHRKVLELHEKACALERE